MRGIRTLVPLVLAFGVLLGLVSCSGSREANLYRAERLAWAASRLEANLQIAPDTPPTTEETGNVLEAYRKLLEASQEPAGLSAADSTLRRNFARLRAQAQLGMVQMHRYRGEADQARVLLESARREHHSDLPVSLHLHGELANECLVVGDVEGAAEVFKDMGFNLPARTKGGRAVFTVLDAPIRAADLLFEIGHTDQARELLKEAKGRYEALISESEEDEVAAVSWIELGNVAVRLGDHDEAVRATKRSQQIADSPMVRARALFLFGLLNQLGGRDLDAAISAYRQFLDSFPKDENAPEALLRIAICLTAQKRYDDVLTTVEQLRRDYPRARWEDVRASLLVARTLVLADRWPDGLREYRSLISKHPTSPQALLAPFEIADYYRKVGETDVRAHTLERALEDFDRLAEAHEGTALSRLIAEKAIQALMELERWDEAVPRLIDLPSVSPDHPRNPIAWMEAARIASEHLDDRARAIQIWTRIVEEYPESDLADQARAKISG